MKTGDHAKKSGSTPFIIIVFHPPFFFFLILTIDVNTTHSVVWLAAVLELIALVDAP
jgi:hypothetical protein